MLFSTVITGTFPGALETGQCGSLERLQLVTGSHDVTGASSRPFRSLGLASTSRLRAAAISDPARRNRPDGRSSTRAMSLALPVPVGSTTYDPCPGSQFEVALKATSLLGSYRVNSLLASSRRPMNLRTNVCRVPTPIGPSVARRTSTSPRRQRGAFVWSLTNAQTAAAGRSMAMLFSTVTTATLLWALETG